MAGKKKPSVYSMALQQVQQANKDKQGQPAEQLDSQMEEQSAIRTSEQQNSQTVKQQTVQESKHSDSQPVKQQRIKATFYLQPEDIIAIDEMQTRRFRENGKKPEKSELVSEAIQLLSRQQNS